jgi:hypothetical protein
VAVGDRIERAGKKRGTRHSRGLARAQTNRKAAFNPVEFWLLVGGNRFTDGRYYEFSHIFHVVEGISESVMAIKEPNRC